MTMTPDLPEEGVSLQSIPISTLNSHSCLYSGCATQTQRDVSLISDQYYFEDDDYCCNPRE